MYYFGDSLDMAGNLSLRYTGVPSIGLAYYSKLQAINEVGDLLKRCPQLDIVRILV